MSRVIIREFKADNFIHNLILKTVSLNNRRRTSNEQRFPKGGLIEIAAKEYANFK